MKSSLNHVYRTIWSEVLNTWVAVSELTSAKGKRSGSSLLEAVVAASKNGRKPNRKFRFKPIESFLRPFALAVACCYTLNTQANPIGAQVVNGTAAINQSGNTLNIANSPNAIINWQGFSINSGETTRFIQQSASSAVLNRVLGSDPSVLLGTLTSNGKVFLVNPAGILVGQGARIDVAGFVASTLNISNSNFLVGNLNFDLTPNAGTIQNNGAITTPEGGTVYLVAPQIENNGIINTPKGETILAAGNTVQLLDTGTPGVAVQVTGTDNNATNLGQILADSGRIGMVGAVVKNSGAINAGSMVSEGGRVFLKAANRAEAGGTITANGTKGGTIEVLGNQVGVMDGATITANGAQGGGTVLIGGDYQGKNPAVQNAQVTYFAKSANISADATQNGNGGKVIVWADDTTRAYGSISARGGNSGGNGGFVETSGRRYLDVTSAPNLAAPHGNGGTWLLDPYDIIIGATDTPGTYTGSPNFVGAGGASPSYIGASIIAGILDLGSSVIVDTTGSGGGTGNITVDSAINTTTAGAATLTLKAHNDIFINAPLAMNNSLVLTANQDATGGGSVFIYKLVTATGAGGITASGNDIVFDSLDGGATYGQLNAGASTIILNATNVITPNIYGAAVEVAAASLINLGAVNGIATGGKIFVGNVAGTIQFNNTNNSVNIYNISNTPAGRIFTGSNANGAVRLESNDTLYATTVDNLTAGGDVVLRMNKLAIGATGINANANTVYLSPYNNSPVPSVSIGGTDTFNLTGADISKITAGKIVIGNDSFGNYAPTVNIATSVPVSISNAANLEIWGGAINTGAPGFTNTGGQVSLVGDAMSIGGIVDVGAGGLVWLKAKSYSQNIDLGGTDTTGILGLSTAELGLITANTLRIGDLLNAGNTNVSAAISPANVTTLSLETGGGITQGAPGTISATNMAINAVGNVVLDTAPNSVTNLAAHVSGAGSNFSFKNAGALNVGAGIDSLSGINLSSISGIFDPLIPDSVVALSSGGALTQSAGALLAGKAVYAEGSRVILTELNPIGVIAGKATGSATGDIFNYTSSNGIWATTVNGFSGISTNNPTVMDPVGITLSGGSAGVTQDTAGVIDAGAGTGGLMLNTTGPVALFSANNVGALATGAGVGQIDFNNSGALTLGIAGNGVSALSMWVNITAGGLLMVSAPVTTSGLMTVSLIGVGVTNNSTITGPGGVSINAGTGTLSETGSIVAPTLFTQATGGTTLNGANAVSSFAATDTGAVSLTNTAATLALDAITAASLMVDNPGAISISPAGYVNASGTGDAIVLNTGAGGGGGFINSASVGAAALSAPNGRWLVYAASPGSVVKGGLTSAFRHYNGTYANYANPVEAGNGFIYASTPGVLSVDATLASGIASNTYGTAPTAIFGYTIGNPAIADNEDLALIAGPPAFTPTISNTTSAGSYTVSYLSGLTSAAGYTFTPGLGLAYTVDPAALTLVTANNASKTYGTTLTFAGTEFTPTGLLNGDTISGVSLTSLGAANTANAGAYAITPSAAVFSAGSASNYTLTYVDGTLTVNPFAVSMTGSRTYDGSPNVAANIFTLGALANGETLTLSGAGVLASKNVITNGAVTLGTLVLGNGTGLASNYTFTGGTQTATITQLALTGAAVAAGSSTYAATLTPGSVSFGNIVSGDTVTSVASVNTSALSSSLNPVVGTYTQTASTTLTGADAANYSFVGFTSGANYTVNPLALTGSITAGSSTYGAALTPGTATFINVAGADAVSGTVTVNTAGNTSTSGNLRAGSYTGIQSVGALAGADAGNYTFAGVAGNYTVNPLALTGSITAGSSIYGATLTPGTATFTNVVGADAVTSGTVTVNTAGNTSTSGNLNVGGYTGIQSVGALAGADAANYTFAGVVGNYTVNPLTLTGSVATGSSIYGSVLTPGTVTFTNVVGADAVTPGTVTVNTAGNTSTSGNLRAGSYTGIQSVSALTGADAGNYIFAGVVGNYTVNPLALTGSITAGSSTYGSALTLGTVTFTNVAGADVITPATVTVNTAGNTSTSGNLRAGSYTGIQSVGALAGADAANYTFAGVVGNYTVNPLALTGSITAGSSIYGATLTPGTATFTNVVGADAVTSGTVTVNTAGNTSTSGNLNVGGYTGIQSVGALTGADAGNYIFAGVVGNYTVNPRPVTFTVDPGQGKTYGQFDPTLITFNDTAGAMQVVAGDTLMGGVTRAAGENAGIYAVGQGSLTSANNPNYNITFVGNNFTINPALLSIVANPHTKVYGSADPAQSFVANGLMQNAALGIDDVAAAAGTLFSGAMTRPAGENVGSYTLAQGTLSAGGNYTITGFTSNILTITPAILAIIANADSKMYDGLPYSGGNGVTYSGLASWDTASVVTGTLTYSGSSQGAINTGSYLITPGGLNAGSNYTVSFVDGALTITPDLLPPAVLQLVTSTTINTTTDPATTTTTTTTNPVIAPIATTTTTTGANLPGTTDPFAGNIGGTTGTFGSTDTSSSTTTTTTTSDTASAPAENGGSTTGSNGDTGKKGDKKDDKKEDKKDDKKDGGNDKDDKSKGKQNAKPENC